MANLQFTVIGQKYTHVTVDSHGAALPGPEREIAILSLLRKNIRADPPVQAQ